MEKMSIFDKNNEKIIDTVKYNGKYIDVVALRNKLITAGAVLFGAVAFLCAQIFLI